MRKRSYSGLFFSNLKWKQADWRNVGFNHGGVYRLNILHPVERAKDAIRAHR